jgi:hypothetical protein
MGTWGPDNISLQEQPILNQCDLNGLAAFLVILGDVINPRAHRIAPHQPGIAGRVWGRGQDRTIEQS